MVYRFLCLLVSPLPRPPVKALPISTKHSLHSLVFLLAVGHFLSVSPLRPTSPLFLISYVRPFLRSFFLWSFVSRDTTDEPKAVNELREQTIEEK